jgi:acetyl/propionyl-CoA carboxylase alpha subunit
MFSSLLIANRGEVARRVTRAFETFRLKKAAVPAKKHGNIPL